MKKYAAYLKEKYNRELIENEYGFIEYEVYEDRSLYIYTLFVTEEGRNNGQGKGFEDIVIEKENPSVIFCDIDKYSNDWVLALVSICKKANYKVFNDMEDKVILYKELG
jgi:hypothetical protein